MMFRDRFDDDEDEDKPKDSEITLGLGSILGIFFGLVLLCGLFFGFGYSLGHGSSPLHVHNPSAATPETPPPGTSSAIPPNGVKPAAQQAVPPPAPADPNAAQTTVAQTTTGTTAAATGSQPPAQQPVTAPQQAPATQPAAQQQTVKPGVAQQVFQAAVPRTPSQSAPAHQYMVQVAAVSRPHDASVLVSALQQRGFHAITRSESQDHLMHVQIGPFPSAAAANQVRTRLMADGYNAILKQ